VGYRLKTENYKLSEIVVTPLKRINTKGGDVLHAMKKSDPEFLDFGEAYFSIIKNNSIKAWKRHKKMTLNLVVPYGKVRFVFFDNRRKSLSDESFTEVILSKENYCRITVPPLFWMGFEGQEKGASIILNIANILHDDQEVDRKNIDEIGYNWRNNI